MQNRSSKRLVLFAVGLALLLGGIQFWVWNRQLSSNERRLVGRWNYRQLTPQREPRVLDFRDDRIAVGYFTNGSPFMQDWYISGQSLVLIPYERRRYGDRTLQSKLHQGLNSISHILRGAEPHIDRPQSYTLVWNGPDQVEMHQKSPINNQVYILQLHREEKVK